MTIRVRTGRSEYATTDGAIRVCCHGRGNQSMLPRKPAQTDACRDIVVTMELSLYIPCVRIYLVDLDSTTHKPWHLEG